jgi:hypothetical protein
MQKLLLSVLFGLSCIAAQAATVPTDLPRHDGQPPSKKKPVKVYILSGQSNWIESGVSQHLPVSRSECHAVQDAGGRFGTPAT